MEAAEIGESDAGDLVRSGAPIVPDFVGITPATNGFLIECRSAGNVVRFLAGSFDAAVSAVRVGLRGHPLVGVIRPPAPSQMPRTRPPTWTPERELLLRFLWPRHTDLSLMLAELNRLEGVAIESMHAISQRACDLKLGRRGRLTRDGSISIAGLIEGELPAHAVPAPWAEVCEWANRWKIETEEGARREDDMRIVNQARQAAGLPPFRLIRRQHEPRYEQAAT